MVDVSEVAENIYMIDDNLYSLQRFGSVYLLNEEKKALIDTGPANSANLVLDGIRKVGIRPEDIDYLIVTHIHLDHAGGAGVLIKNMPRAQVVVHHKGARYMVNPEKLVSSVMKSHGDEGMMRYGEVVPIRADRVRAVYDGDVLRLSQTQLLEFIDAPGHAPHQMCIFDSRNKGVFTGDAAGIYIAERELLFVVPSPPSFDAEQGVDTLERLKKLNASRIYFAHFGVTSEVQEKLQLAIDKHRVLDSVAAEAVEKHGFDGLMERMIAYGYAELEPIKGMDSLYKYLTEVTVPVNAAGYIEYYRGKHQTN